MKPSPRHSFPVLFILTWVFAPLQPSAAGELQLGVGAHYWRSLSTIRARRFDDQGVVWCISARRTFDAPFQLGLELEQFPKYFGGAPHPVYVPAAYLMAGRGLYAAVGIGGYFTDGGFTQDVLYAFRAGLMFEILPSVFLDGHVNYRFEEWKRLSEQARDIHADTLTLGAALRIGF